MKRKCLVFMLCMTLVFGQISYVHADPDLSQESEAVRSDQGITTQEEPNTLDYKEDEVIIVYEDEMADVDKVEQAIENDNMKSLDETEQALADLGIAEQEEILTQDSSVNGSVAVATLPEDVSVNEAIRKLEDTENVAYVQKNYVYHLQTTSINDKMSANAYYLNNLNLYEAWDSVRADGSTYNKTGTPITVAVLDTGINYDTSERHEELQDVGSGGNIWYTYAYDAYQCKRMSKTGTDWYDSTGTFTDYIGHGTTVASLISSSVNNGKGVAGISYNGRVLPVNVFEQPVLSSNEYLGNKLYGFDAGASTSTLIEAYDYVLKYADKLNIKVINMSLGGSADNIDEALQDSIEQAYDKGILTVASAGNYYSSQKMYPASFEHVLSVASVDSNNQHSDFSQYNDAVDISAPGERILAPAADYAYSLKKDRLYWYKANGYTNVNVNGTSFSAPIVSGIAALLYAADPDMTPDQAEKYLTSTATDVGDPGKDNYYGYGVVDAYKAVQAALGNDVESSVSSTSSVTQVTANPSLSRLISSMSLSVTKYVYNGEARKPSATVTYSGRKIANKITSSTVSIKLTYGGGRKNVGTYRVRTTGQNTFNGSIVQTFKIIPRATTILASASKTKGFKVKWKKRTLQVDGYQVQYATKSNMSDLKTVTIRQNTTDAKTITGLKAKKKYYVRVRTYKKVDGKNYFSNWSATKAIKTK